jgi:hypothetical protein|tara:strand:- start:84 stop:296 length:213 start_codon:yes stop_codon:yes gene_type:complete
MKKNLLNIYIAGLVLIILFPPLQRSGGSHKGFGFIFTSHWKINISLILVEILILSIALGLIYFNKNKRGP